MAPGRGGSCHDVTDPEPQTAAFIASSQIGPSPQRAEVQREEKIGKEGKNLPCLAENQIPSGKG